MTIAVPNRDEIICQWKQIAGIPVELSGGTFTAPDVEDTEELGFMLTVTDEEGLWDTDEVIVCVNNSGISLLWEYETGGEIYSSPTIADIDGDADLDVVFGCCDWEAFRVRHICPIH